MDLDQGTRDRTAPPPASRPASALLAEIEARLAEAYPPAAVTGLLAPIREALDTPADKRDPVKLGAAFELVEDVLEAAALAAA